MCQNLFNFEVRREFQRKVSPSDKKFNQKVSLSLQRSYDVLLTKPDKISIHEYNVYKHFANFGFQLVRKDISGEQLPQSNEEIVDTTKPPNEFYQKLRIFQVIRSSTLTESPNIVSFIYDVYFPTEMDVLQQTPHYNLIILSQHTAVWDLLQFMLTKVKQVLVVLHSETSVSVLHIRNTSIPSLV